MRLFFLGLTVVVMFTSGGVPSYIPSLTAEAQSQNFVCTGTSVADEEAVAHWNPLGAELKIGTRYGFETDVERTDTGQQQFNLIKWCDGTKEQEQAF